MGVYPGATSKAASKIHVGVAKAKAKPKVHVRVQVAVKVPMYGTIKSYNNMRGFGFIDCEATQAAFAEDVFVNSDHIMGECDVHDKVIFNVVLNASGLRLDDAWGAWTSPRDADAKAPPENAKDDDVARAALRELTCTQCA